MSYTIQIEPPLTTIKTTETKRQSFYTCIRYASKLIKLRTEVRKHQTLSNDMIPATKYDTHNSYGYDNKEEQEEVETLYDEKVNLVSTNKPSYYTSRRDSQLALPSRLKYISSPAVSILHEQKIIDNNEDEEEDQDFDDDCSSFDDEDSSDELDNYYMDDSYSSALQKLSGISFKQNKPNTAVLITLSPCALAAANAARQKRQKVRISH